MRTAAQERHVGRGGEACAVPDPANRSLARAAVILDVLAHDALSLSEIARHTELSTSTTHRLLQSMEDLGFVRRGDGGLYSMGSRFQRSTVEKMIRHTLATIRDEAGESCQFWVKLHTERLCVAIADSGKELRQILAEGTRIPLEDGGSAGALLASTPAALESLEINGWVESVDGRTPGVSSVSIPLVVGGRRHGAVCLVVPVSRLRRSPGHDFGEVMRKHLDILRAELSALL